jgi:aconitate hydratase
VHDALRPGRREFDASLVAAGGGARRTVPLRHDLSPRQANLLISGGVINWLRERLAA